MKYTILMSGLDIFTHALNVYLCKSQASSTKKKNQRRSDQTALPLKTLHDLLCDVDLCSSLCYWLCRLLKYGLSSCSLMETVAIRNLTWSQLRLVQIDHKGSH